MNVRQIINATSSKLFSSAVFRRIGVLSLAVGVGQLITIGATPLLSRIYDPHEFGIYGVISSVALLLGNISALRYDLAIVLATKQVEAVALAWLCAILIALSAALPLVVWVIALTFHSVGLDSSLTDYINYLPLVTVQVISVGIFLIGSQWATRAMKFRPQATYQLTRAIAVVIGQSALGFLIGGATGLLVGQIVGFFLAGGWLIYSSLGPNINMLSRRPSISKIQMVARKYKRFPIYVAPQELIASSSQSILMGVLAYYFGAGVVGFYWMSQRIMQQPSNFMGQAVRQVLIQHLFRRRAENLPIVPHIQKMTLALTIFALSFTIPVITFGPTLFSIILGSEWHQAGEFAQWVSVWVVGLMFNLPSWCALHALGKQRQMLIWDAMTVGAQTAAMAVAGLFGSATGAVAAYALVGASFFVSRSIYALLAAQAEDNRSQVGAPS